MYIDKRKAFRDSENKGDGKKMVSEEAEAQER